MNRHSLPPVCVVYSFMYAASVHGCSSSANNPLDASADASSEHVDHDGGKAGPDASEGHISDASHTGRDGEPSEPRACPDCRADEACVTVLVTVHEETSQLPWIKWSFLADGAGTVMASVTDTDDRVLARGASAGADMSKPGAQVEIELGCVPAEPLEARAFLDENDNAGDGEITSSEQVDACMGGQTPALVTASPDAGEHVLLTLTLAQSCDPSAD